MVRCADQRDARMRRRSPPATPAADPVLNLGLLLAESWFSDPTASHLGDVIECELEVG